MAIDSNPNKSYIKVVAVFDSAATLQDVIDAWTVAPGPSPTGVELFKTSLTGFLNANYDTPVITNSRSTILQRTDGKFEVYEKCIFTGTPKGSVTNQQFANSKDAQLNALKGVYNGQFAPPPVAYTNAVFHIHKSWVSIDEPLDVEILPVQPFVDAVIV